MDTVKSVTLRGLQRAGRKRCLCVANGVLITFLLYQIHTPPSVPPGVTLLTGTFVSLGLAKRDSALRLSIHLFADVSVCLSVNRTVCLCQPALPVSLSLFVCLCLSNSLPAFLS